MDASFSKALDICSIWYDVLRDGKMWHKSEIPTAPPDLRNITCLLCPSIDLNRISWRFPKSLHRIPKKPGPKKGAPCCTARFRKALALDLQRQPVLHRGTCSDVFDLFLRDHATHLGESKQSNHFSFPSWRFGSPWKELTQLTESTIKPSHIVLIHWLGDVRDIDWEQSETVRFRSNLLGGFVVSSPKLLSIFPPRSSDGLVQVPFLSPGTSSPTPRVYWWTCTANPRPSSL